MMIPSVGPGVYAIDTRYVRPRLDAAHLLIDHGEAAFIDTGTAASIPHLLGALAALNLSPEAVRWVLLTHIHLDHAGGAGALMDALPAATLVVHPRGARHMADPSRLIAGSIAVYGEPEFKRLYGEIRPIDPARIRSTTDGERLSVGSRALEFIHTPGHARHHHCIVDLDGDAVFTGDTFGLSYQVFDVNGAPFIFPTTTPIHFDPDAAHASIDRICAYNTSAAYLTHYSRVTDLPRLAADLHSDLDVFAALTLAAADVDALAAGIAAHLAARLVAHGYTGPAAERDLWLSLDVQLNAQGLWFWREHRR
jgi:glyoxylase-like metal-dependent hydrolase (beta-lactamase superfamily II)